MPDSRSDAPTEAGGTENSNEARARFEAEAKEGRVDRSLDAARSWANAARGERNTEELCEALVAMAPYLVRRRQSNDAIDAYEEAIERADPESQAPLLARALNENARLLLRFNQVGRAREQLAQSLELGRRHDRTHHQMATLFLMAEAEARVGENDSALERYAEALALAEELDLADWEGDISLERGSLRQRMGDLRGALSDFERATDAFKDAEQDAGGLEATLRSGEALSEGGRHPDALEAFKEALALAEEQKDDAAAGRALVGLSQAYDQLGEDQEALRALDQRARILSKGRDPFAETLALLDLARLARKKSRFDGALRELEYARDVAKRTRRSGLVAQVLLERGECHLAAGDEAQALNDLRASAELALDAGRNRDAQGALERMVFVMEDKSEKAIRKVVRQVAERENPQRRHDARAFLDRGRLLLHFGDLDGATDFLEKARHQAESGSDRRLHGAVLQAIGQTRRYAGFSEEALRAFGKRVELERTRESERDVAFALNSLGATQVDLGRFAEARASFEEGLEIMESFGDPGGTAMLLNGLATPLHLEGESERALDCLARGLAIQEKLGRMIDVSVTLNIRGDVLRDLGQAAESLADLERAYALVEEHGDERGLSFVLPRIGRSRLAVGQDAAALEDLEMGVEVGARNPDRRQIARALHALGDAQLQVGDHRSAIDSLEEAFSIVEGMEDALLRPAIEKSLDAARAS